jgi:hypothetical protein
MTKERTVFDKNYEYVVPTKGDNGAKSGENDK